VTDARSVARWELAGVTGAVVVVDVIRAFSTAGYAFGAGASAIYLVGTVDEALAFVADHPGSQAMGEVHGRRPDGFAYPNSPAVLAEADVAGRTLVQRTSAGTQGAVAAVDATRLWAASLVCASATADAVTRAGLGAPTYVITGRFEDRPDRPATDDELAAQVIDRRRLGLPVDAEDVATALLSTDEAVATLALGDGHVDPHDIELCARLDAFDFAMEVTRDRDGLRLDRVDPVRRTARAAPT
jgi:2-phosphosulfolactate phosphatase